MCDRELREKWIRKKYVEKAYLKSLPTSDEVMSPIKRWTVSRIKRRSPLRTVSSPVKSSQSQDKPVPQGRYLAQQTQHVGPMLFYRWASVADGGPTVKQYWTEFLCFLGCVLFGNGKKHFSYFTNFFTN